MSLICVPTVAKEAPVIVILGDSLSAGYEMDKEQSWVHLLELRLAEYGYTFRILNSSITGDTTQGGLGRLPRLLDRYQPALVIIELGGNDGLRGINPATTRENMEKMISASQSAGARVLLAGIKLPPNYGQTYIEEFESIYVDLACRAFNPELMQSDGIHPNENGQPALLDNVWQVLQPELETMVSTSAQ